MKLEKMKGALYIIHLYIIVACIEISLTELWETLLVEVIAFIINIEMIGGFKAGRYIALVLCRCYGAGQEHDTV